MKATARWLSRPILVLALALPAALSSVTHAEIIDFAVGLTGAEEVPPVDTTGTGDVSIQLDTDTGAILIGGSFDLLMGSATTAALIGFAPPGFIGNIELIALAIIPLDDARTAGDVSGSGTLTPDQIQGLLTQQTYINIRSSAFPEGELRGQVVPTPSTLLLGGLVLSSFASFRRR